MIPGLCIFCKKNFQKREKKYKFCSLICANRFNLNGLNQVILPKQSKELAEFIGICLGDGYVSQYQTAIKLNSIADNEYIPYVFNLSRNLFLGASVSLMPNKQESSTDIRINSRITADFLRDMGIVPNAKSIPHWIFNNPIYAKACVRGLFDTEGSLSFKKYLSKEGFSIYKQLNFTNIDIKLMTFVRDILIDLGLKPTMTLKRSLYLSNEESIAVFREQIGFSNPKLLKRSLIATIDAYNKFFHQSSI